jgi:rubrerythrin
MRKVRLGRLAQEKAVAYAIEMSAEGRTRSQVGDALERQGVGKKRITTTLDCVFGAANGKCEECGVNCADPPSRLCPGCEAYQSHQQ